MPKAKIPQKKIEDFYDYDFESVDTCPEDCWGDYTHANFFKKYVVPMFRSELKKMATSIGAQVIVNGNYFEVSGFFYKDDKYVYFHIGDVRYNIGGHWYDNVLYRTAASPSDYRGGANNYCSYETLAKHVNEMLEGF